MFEFLAQLPPAVLRVTVMALHAIAALPQRGPLGWLLIFTPAVLSAALTVTMYRRGRRRYMQQAIDR